MRPYGDPGQHVPDEAGKPKTSRDGAENQGSGQPTSQRKNDGEVVHSDNFLKPLPKGALVSEAAF
jgi:hypothetical protein